MLLTFLMTDKDPPPSNLKNLPNPPLLSTHYFCMKIYRVSKLYISFLYLFQKMEKKIMPHAEILFEATLFNLHKFTQDLIEKVPLQQISQFFSPFFLYFKTFIVFNMNVLTDQLGNHKENACSIFSLKL